MEGNQYFLTRLRELEKTYGMESWLFQALYETHKEELPGYNRTTAAVDYCEWAFLCENLESISADPFESPPACGVGQQKPEQCSGFTFIRGERDRFRSSVFSKCRETPLGHVNIC